MSRSRGESNPCGISRLQWLEGTDQLWWVQPVVDAVPSEVEEMLFCRRTIERGGPERGRRWRKKRGIVTLQWRWEKIRRWERGRNSEGFCSLFANPQKSLDPNDPGKARKPFCEKVAVNGSNCSCNQTSEKCKVVKVFTFCNHFAAHQTHPKRTLRGGENI